MIYESCVYNQVKDNGIEDLLLPRALYFAKALETLFEYDEMNLRVFKLTKDEFEKLQWLVFFEDPQGDFSDLFDNNADVLKKYLPGVWKPGPLVSIKTSSLVAATVETQQEQQQEQESEQLKEQLMQQLNQMKLMGDIRHIVSSKPKSFI